MLSESPEETQGKFKHRTILKVKLTLNLRQEASIQIDLVHPFAYNTRMLTKISMQYFSGLKRHSSSLLWVLTTQDEFYTQPSVIYYCNRTSHTTLVASNFPPRPTSRTATSTCYSQKKTGEMIGKIPEKLKRYEESVSS